MTDIFTEVDDVQTNDEADIMETFKTRYGDGNTIDVEKLTRGKFEADRHIAQLERELEQLRQGQTKNQTIEEILTRIRETSQPKQVEQPHQAPQTPQKPDEPNVEEIVRNLIEKRESETQLQKNHRQVQEALEAAYGAEAQRELNRKAKELGISLNELKDHAGKNPNVFFRLIGLQPGHRPPAPQGAVAPRTTTPPTQPGASGQRDKAYYDRLKASNPKEYFSQKVQNQMYKDWIANPERFQG